MNSRGVGVLDGDFATGETRETALVTDRWILDDFGAPSCATEVRFLLGLKLRAPVNSSGSAQLSVIVPDPLDRTLR